MIANIVTGSSFLGCTQYAYGKDEAEVIAFKDIIPDNHIIAAKCFEHQAQMNKRVKNPVGHISISFKPEDRPRLTNEFMRSLFGSIWIKWVYTTLSMLWCVIITPLIHIVILSSIESIEWAIVSLTKRRRSVV